MLNFPSRATFHESARRFFLQVKPWASTERICCIAAKIISLAILKEGCRLGNGKIVVMSILSIGILTAELVSTFYRDRQIDMAHQLQALAQKVAEVERSTSQLALERRVIWHF